MDDILADVELFISTFIHKDSIRTKAVSLMVAILLAVERVVQFWTRPGRKWKGFKEQQEECANVKEFQVSRAAKVLL